MGRWAIGVMIGGGEGVSLILLEYLGIVTCRYKHVKCSPTYKTTNIGGRCNVCVCLCGGVRGSGCEVCDQMLGRNIRSNLVMNV